MTPVRHCVASIAFVESILRDILEEMSLTLAADIIFVSTIGATTYVYIVTICTDSAVLGCTWVLVETVRVSVANRC